jgi:hypothetical protein
MVKSRISWMILVALAIFPMAAPCQSDQRIPLDLRDQSQEEIGAVFSQQLKALVKNSTRFRLAKENEPNITITVGSGTASSEFLCAYTVIWTTTIKTAQGALPVYLDYWVGVMSPAHARKDAEDVLDFTNKTIVERFRDLSGERQ